MKEDSFVDEALAAATDVLLPPLSVARGATLLYQVTVDNRLELTVDPKKPSRGRGGFQTDLCVFEEITPNLKIPRVVMEFKPDISTHDVLTYNAKAAKHKTVYPYLRYGLILGRPDTIPARLFIHNDSLDFCVAAGSFRSGRLHEILAALLQKEITTSRQLEAVAFGKLQLHLFRTEIQCDGGGGKIK